MTQRSSRPVLMALRICETLLASNLTIAVTKTKLAHSIIDA
jgi:hypothetical protein